MTTLSKLQQIEGRKENTNEDFSRSIKFSHVYWHVVSLQTHSIWVRVMFSPVDHSNKQIAVSFCACSAVEIHTSPLTRMMEMDGFVDVMMGFILSMRCFRHISFSCLTAHFVSGAGKQIKLFLCISQEKNKPRNKVQFKVAFLVFMTRWNGIHWL